MKNKNSYAAQFSCTEYQQHITMLSIEHWISILLLELTCAKLGAGRILWTFKTKFKRYLNDIKTKFLKPSTLKKQGM